MASARRELGVNPYAYLHKDIAFEEIRSTDVISKGRAFVTVSELGKSCSGQEVLRSPIVAALLFSLPALFSSLVIPLEPQ